MRLKEFFRKLLRQTTYAALVLAIVLLIGEKLVPGSVLPFVDVIDLLPVVVGALAVTSLLP